MTAAMIGTDLHERPVGRLCHALQAEDAFDRLEATRKEENDDGESASTP